jgi:hypothetical protein
MSGHTTTTLKLRNHVHHTTYPKAHVYKPRATLTLPSRQPLTYAIHLQASPTPAPPHITDIHLKQRITHIAQEPRCEHVFLQSQTRDGVSKLLASDQ